MLVSANFNAYPSGLSEVAIPLQDDKYLKLKLVEEIVPEVVDESGNVVEPEKTIDKFALDYYDGVLNQELLSVGRSELNTLMTTIRDLGRQMRE